MVLPLVSREPGAGGADISGRGRGKLGSFRRATSHNQLYVTSPESDEVWGAWVRVSQDFVRFVEQNDTAIIAVVD